MNTANQAGNPYYQKLLVLIYSGVIRGEKCVCVCVCVCVCARARVSVFLTQAKGVGKTLQFLFIFNKNNADLQGKALPHINPPCLEYLG